MELAFERQHYVQRIGGPLGLAPDFCTRYSESLTALDPDAFDLFPPWSRPARNGLETRSA